MADTKRTKADLLIARGAISAVTIILCAVEIVFGQIDSRQHWEVLSPDGQVEATVRTTAEGGLEFRSQLRDGEHRRPAVDWSPLGIATMQFVEWDVTVPSTTDFSRTITFVSKETSKGEDVYSLQTGKRRENHARYSQLSLTFRDDEMGTHIRLDVRAYDEGLALRYVLPEPDLLYHRLDFERTAFNIGLGAQHWGAPYSFPTKWTSGYEKPYRSVPSGTSLTEKMDAGWSLPALFKREEVWILLHESGVDKTFHGSHLQPDAPEGIYTIAGPLPEENQGFGSVSPSSPTPWYMPWRFMIVSDQLGDILESNLVFHLAQSSKVSEASWIEPGVASFHWASDHESGRNPTKLRRFIDLSHEMGWRYALIDANWNLSSETALEDLTAYADERGVGLFFWYNSGGRHNSVTEQPRNVMDDRMRRRTEFAKLQSLGVRGVKVDFFSSDKQDRIRQHLEILEDAADHHLMVNFHGTTAPRGWQRTWPNLVTAEAVVGGEWYSFDLWPEFGEIAPSQNTIHPFLRNVIGSMDYTPGLFSKFPTEHLTTPAHEAALGVVFESGVQHMIDTAGTYADLPDDYKQYFGDLPAAWDETRYIAGSPGSFVVLARRKDDRWFVAGINGTADEREMSVDIAGLSQSFGEALILEDRPGVRFSSRRTTNLGSPARVTVQPYGGFVIVLGG